SFFHDRSPDDVLLLYYSGHGILARSNRLFLATSGSNLDTPRTRSVSAQEIRDFIEESRAQRQIVVHDCCHSAAFAWHSKAASTPQRFVQGGIGDLVISANPLMRASQIDPGITVALASEEFRTRLGAVGELTLQMDEVHTVAARAARRLLQRHLDRERDYQVR